MRIKENMSLKSLEQFKRSPSQSLDDYINEFERIHNKVKAHKILLPDSYVAYRLLESANLDQTKSELVPWVPWSSTCEEGRRRRCVI